MQAYDYIIVGAGSAGCVLAARLTEDPAATVLLLEAGSSDKKQEVHIPAAFAKLFKTPLDWAYETEPEPELNGRRMYWPRGKMLGGSSSMNAMMYVRSPRQDYDHWRELGNVGWGFDDVLPYFKKGERQGRGASTYHGASGPLCVEDLRSINPLTRAFVEAGAAAGIPRNDDFNGAAQEGIGFTQVTQHCGQRHSTADAYLRPALRRPNLTVQTCAQAQRVLFDGTCATGVAYSRDDQSMEARARRDVILCGGAINSPQLLLLSGVGPAAHLRELGISIVADLPGVGQNLQDHLGVAVAQQSRQPLSLASAESLGNIGRYLLFRNGPLTSSVAEAMAFVSTKGQQPPNLELIFLPVYFLDHGFANPAGHGYTIGAVILRPQSRGSITLRSRDPLAPPAIQPNYLTARADLDLLVEGIKRARKLMEAPAFDPYRGAEYWPGSDARSDEALAEHVRAHAQTLYHPVGTCKMGPEDDALAVVDARLRVRGVEGLRVVDASVMPTLIGGHTNAATIMIAEKAADVIRADAAARSTGATTTPASVRDERQAVQR